MITQPQTKDKAALEIYDLLMSQINPNLTNANYTAYMQKVHNLSPEKQAEAMLQIRVSYQQYQTALIQLEQDYGSYLSRYEKKLNLKAEANELNQLKQTLSDS